MTAPINLNRFRKAKEKAEKSAVAVTNRVKFGRTKAEKSKDQAIQSKTAHKVDQSKIEE